MKLKLGSKKFLERLFVSNLYKNIDEMPIYNWWQIHESGDLTYVMKHRRKVLFMFIYGYFLNGKWEDLYNQFIDKFGLSDHFKMVIDKKKAIVQMKISKMLNDDFSLQTLIDVAEIELKEMNDISGGGFLSTKANIEKNMGFQIDAKGTSVSEFYTYINLAVDNGRIR